VIYGGIYFIPPSIFLVNCNTGEVKMPKIKTRRAAAKRFQKTGSGKYKFRKSHASHILTKKTTKRKRSLRRDQIIDGSNLKAVRRMLPNG
jgi:large subunit ribosomal protein L35